MNQPLPIRRRIMLIASILLMSAWLGGERNAFGAEPVTSAAITRPSQFLKLAFVAPGIVRDVAVKEGEPVKVGQVLLTLDDRMDQKQLESMRIQGDSLSTIEAQKTDWEQKKVDYKRKLEMKANNVASDSEVEEAKLAVDLSFIRIKLAEEEHQAKKLDADRQQVKVDLMKLVSPIDGIVQTLNLGPGEMADPQNRDGAVVLVKNDPLWVEFHLPTNQAEKLEMGESLEVRYNSAKDWQQAKIIYFAPKADAASATQLVRLELPNKSSKASGQEILVKLPAKVTGEDAPASPAANVNP